MDLLAVAHIVLVVSVQARRHLLADQANAQDQQLYETKQAQLEHEIEQASQLLESSKNKLQTAREEKKRKLQYEVQAITGLIAFDALLVAERLQRHMYVAPASGQPDIIFGFSLN